MSRYRTYVGADHPPEDDEPSRYRCLRHGWQDDDEPCWDCEWIAAHRLNPNDVDLTEDTDRADHRDRQ